MHFSSIGFKVKETADNIKMGVTDWALLVYMNVYV